VSFSLKLIQFHSQFKGNKWIGYFTVFVRLALAAGFIPSGITKIIGERFTALSINHPMGNYLEALHYTGYYYEFIGYFQVLAAVLLLIPRTATLGAIIYFPIILNICVLSFAVRFEGSMVTSPLMVVANLYLLFWDYDKIKFILPFKQNVQLHDSYNPSKLNRKFSVLFFGGVIITILTLVMIIINIFEIEPRNTIRDCNLQCDSSSYSEACEAFCECIHTQGKTLNECLTEYEKAKQ